MRVEKTVVIRAIPAWHPFPFPVVWFCSGRFGIIQPHSVFSHIRSAIYGKIARSLLSGGSFLGIKGERKKG